MTDFTAIHSGYKASSGASIDDQTGRLLEALEAIRSNDKVSPESKTTTLAEAATLLERAGMVMGTDTGIAQILSGRSVLSLGAGNATSNDPERDAIMAKLTAIAATFKSTPTQLIDFLLDLLEPLKGLPEKQWRARSAVMGEVAKGTGTAKVDDDGNLLVAKDLAKAQDKLRDFERDFGTAATALEGLSDADKRARTKGIELVAKGTTPVGTDGKPVTPAGTTVTTLTQERDEANEVIDDLKGHLSKGLGGKTYTVKPAELKDKSKTRLGL